MSLSLPTVTWNLLADPETPGAVLDRAAAPVAAGVDWALDDDGDLVVPLRYTTGAEAVAQGIRIRLQMFKGEWFADLDAGVPYFQDILGQKFNESRVRAAFRDAILASPGIDELQLLTATFDGPTRKVTVNWRVKTSFGLITGTLGV